MYKLISWKKHLSTNEKIPFYLLATFITILATIGLATVIICIYFGRPIGDDYGAIAYHHSSEWLDHAIKSLQSTGRYGQSVFASLIYGIFGSATPAALAFIVFTWTLTLTYLAVARINTHLKLSLPNLTKIALTGVLVFVLLIVNAGLDGTPPQTWFTFQTFFWSSGVITYTVPLLLLLTGAYLFFIRPRSIKKSSYILYAAVVYVLGLFNEVQPATLFGFSAGLFVLSYLPAKRLVLIDAIRKWRMVYLSTATASFLSLLTLFLSSGNKERRATTGALNFEGLTSAITNKISLLNGSLFYRPRDIILIAAVGFCIAYGLYVFNKKMKAQTANRGIVVGAFILLCSILSSYASITLLILGYGVGTGILPRAFLIPQLLFVTGLIILLTSCFIRIIQLLPTRYTKNILAVTSILVTIALVFMGSRYMDKITTQLNTVMDYAIAWDQQDAVLKEHAKTDPNKKIYISGDHAGVGDGFSIRCVGPYVQNTIWLTDAIEQYYGVKEVCALEDK